MSHAVGPNSGHSPRAGNRTTKKPGAASIVDVVKVFLRLLPKQLKDEAQLAVLELKAKGIKLGIGAAFAVVGLIFLGLAVIALVGAAIAGLSHVMPAWLAALLLVDEPTAALDQERSRAIMELLANLTHEFRLASLVVTHDTEFVPLADRCVTMEDGRLQ